MNEKQRYDVQAKRKDTTEPWSDWARCNNYKRAEQHAAHIEELGYSGRIVVREKQIKKLWGILGKMGVTEANKVTEITDAIFDAGFRLQREVAKEVAKEIFAEFERICVGSQDYKDYVELKEKYTGVSENENKT